MEMQIAKARHDEVDPWAHILEDIGQSAEIQLLDKLTYRNWRFEIHRCLRYLLGYKRTSVLSRIFRGD